MRATERGVVVGIVVAVAALLRIAFVATAQVLSPDAGQFVLYSRNLVESGVYSMATTSPPPPDSFRSPGYPLFLAACRWLGGPGWMNLALAMQVALGTLTVLLCYRLARRFVGFVPSLSAAVLCALSPHLVVSSAFVLTECVTAFLVTAGLWLAAGQHAGPRRFVGVFVLGLAALGNEVFVFVPVVVAWSMRRTSWRQALVAAAIGLLPFAMWTARNATTTLERTGSERMVASVSHGSYPGMIYRDSLFGFPYQADPEQPAMASSWSNLWQVLGPRIAAEPWRFLYWYAIQKPVWLWSWPLVQGRDVFVYEVANSPYERQPVVAATHTLMRVLHLPMMVLAALTAGFVCWRRRRYEAIVGLPALGAIVLLATAAYVPVIPDPRYLQPVRPLLFVLVAVALQGLAAQVAVRKTRRAGSAVAGEAPPAASSG